MGVGLEWNEWFRVHPSVKHKQQAVCMEWRRLGELPAKAEASPSKGVEAKAGAAGNVHCRLQHTGAPDFTVA